MSEVSRFLKHIYYIAPCLLATAGACADLADTDPSVDQVPQEATTFRPDFVVEIEPGLGPFGTFHQTQYCEPGSWAIGYQMRVEGSQGSGVRNGHDDTALNSVKLKCRNPQSGFIEWISSYDGIWGSWHDEASCSVNSNGALKGARMRIEPNQGSGNGHDDTGGNDVEFRCLDGGSIHAIGGMSWGSWGDWKECPANTAVCGLSIQFEPNQGDGIHDDTAMNGLRLECCSL